MLENKNKNKKLEYFLILLFGFFCLYQFFFLFGSNSVNNFFFNNIDGQKLGSLTIKDIFYWNYGLSGRQFMPRPAFFPNLLVQAIVVPFGFNHFLNNLVFSMIMCGITFLSLFLLCYQAAGAGARKRIGSYCDLNPDYFLSWRQILIFCLGFFSVCLFVANKTNFLWSLYTSYHLENLINTILYFYFMLQLVQKTTKTSIFLVSIMIVLGLISNRLFLVTGLIPAWFGVLCLLIFYNNGSYKKLFLWTIWQALIAFCSLLIYLLPEFFYGNEYLIQRSDSKYSFIERVIGLFSYYNSDLSAFFMLCVFISLFGLLYQVVAGKKNHILSKTNTKISWRFFIIISFLSGLFNLLMFLISKGEFDNFDGFDRYFIVFCFLTPSVFLFGLYWRFKNFITYLYIILGLLLVFLVSNQKINYKIYIQKNPDDGGDVYNVNKCINKYIEQGYLFKNGFSLVDYQLNSRNKYGIYFAELRYKKSKNIFFFSRKMRNINYYVNAPNADIIRSYNFIVFFSNWKEMPFSAIPEFVKTYGRPDKVLPCEGNKEKILYYQTPKAKDNLNRKFFAQLTCHDDAYNKYMQNNHYHVLKTFLSHKLPRYLFSKFGINNDKDLKKLAAKIHYFYDCRPVNNYLDDHPIYKKQVDALLN